MRFHTAAALAAMTLLSASAFAQTTPSNPATDHGTPAPAGAMAAPGASMATPAAPGSTAMKGSHTANAATCQSMMDQAMPMMNGMSTGPKKMEAMRHVDMAKTAMNSKDEAGCKTHMQMAMTSMH